jgi:hypothetical protein
MSVVVVATSRGAAEDTARRLRTEGFLARAARRRGKPLVIVHCLNDERDAVVERVKRVDAGARPISAA